MRQPLTNLDEPGKIAARTALEFLKGRLSSPDTVEWALTFLPHDTVKRVAILELLAAQEGSRLKEPFLSAWRLIEESWASLEQSGFSTIDIYRVQERLMSGDRSGGVIEMINRLVAPRLKVESRVSTGTLLGKRKGLRRVDELLHASLTSPGLIDLKVLRIDNLNEAGFLTQLINALDASVQKGMDIAKRIGWDGQSKLWRLGFLYRVEYTERKPTNGIDRDEDQRHVGIAPVVKLLHVVVKRLAELDPSAAKRVVQQWKSMPDPIHLRLWAALSKAGSISTPAEVGEKLLALAEEPFWNATEYPEIAELRAIRFCDFSADTQAEMAVRIRKGLPKRLMSKNIPSDQIEAFRLHKSLLELRRIEVAKAQLPMAVQKWVASTINQFPDLMAMDSVDHHFRKSAVAYWYKAEPDAQFDHLSGEARLRTLESSLSSTRGGWDDDPAERANEWIRLDGNVEKLISDFESIPSQIGKFPRVWDAFGWRHGTGTRGTASTISDKSLKQGRRVISLLLNLERESALQAIEGISHWLSEWRKVVVKSKKFSKIWTHLWPLAVEATNATTDDRKEIDLNLVVTSNEDEPSDLDTLNTPAGRLVDVFLAACPDLDTPSEKSFSGSPTLRKMRRNLVESTGRSGLIAKHRLIEWLTYFLRADHVWTEQYLIAPLAENDSAAIALWRAIARRVQFRDTLAIIGLQLVGRVTDLRLGRESRKSLLSSLVVEALYAFLEKREPSVPYSSIQQAIRSVEDEIRAESARVLQQFVTDLSSNTEPGKSPFTIEMLFHAAVQPFLGSVWPQEQSLVTPGSSAALAKLPASVGDAFAEAVEAVERFLVPFNCWSLHDYGFYERGEVIPAFPFGKSQKDAAALIRLLDATIASTEGAVIPMDLVQALDHVQAAAPEVASTPAFRRLATLARRR